ncbi:hypothetical protein [Paraburkholderia hospita]|jgi:hypothetical protein|uniref:Preprotein translocase subunit SecD n=1 Tax=Paraburkholderia hospita TaxID=169430 RepID=A0AAN1JJP2_9BURK|nr:hypothetical protein [Paraburkholderia hospita]AUT75076.1 hypothetical protein C2L64_43685 [Paraburkholderia hospita]AXF04702.1 hypothetical protein CUJ88_40680 [Paraburkholderia hospita]EIM93271.1 hypothetical protein WQE_50875 [Paraburkholderia hospita]OUL87242.1 hypothetical protein CA601_20700 [Paraburkholderia hospita]OUL89836.1 hypothetical protein CA602_08380 [Paraburkholderia hospita]
MRAEQLLPDHADHIDVGGTTIRKGTVAAFLANARVWSDAQASETARAQAAADIVDALPALRATGLFEVLAIRDCELRAWIDTQMAHVPSVEVQS